jgi:hypothetical protein
LPGGVFVADEIVEKGLATALPEWMVDIVNFRA